MLQITPQALAPRVHDFGKQELNHEVDLIVNEINRISAKLDKLSSAIGAIQPGITVAWHDGSDVLAPGDLVGRDSAGVLALAQAGATLILPLWYAMETGTPGMPVKLGSLGNYALRLADPLTSPTQGDAVWLSEAPGKVQPAATSGGRVRVGHFASRTPNADGTIDVWTNLIGLAVTA
jgi:hypothetical protein